MPFGNYAFIIVGSNEIVLDVVSDSQRRAESWVKPLWKICNCFDSYKRKKDL